MTVLSITLPVPPGINGIGTRRGTYAIAHTRDGMPHAVLSRVAKEWKAAATLAVQLAAREQGWTYHGGELRLAIVRHDRHDVDSGIKLAMDVICSGVGADDARVALLVVSRQGVGVRLGEMRVTLEEE